MATLTDHPLHDAQHRAAHIPDDFDGDGIPDALVTQLARVRAVKLQAEQREHDMPLARETFAVCFELEQRLNEDIFEARAAEETRKRYEAEQARLAESTVTPEEPRARGKKSGA